MFLKKTYSLFLFPTENELEKKKLRAHKVKCKVPSQSIFIATICLVPNSYRKRFALSVSDQSHSVVIQALLLEKFDPTQKV